MDMRIGSIIIILLSIFFAKITFETSKASSSTKSVQVQGRTEIKQITANEIPREITRKKIR